MFKSVIISAAIAFTTIDAFNLKYRNHAAENELFLRTFGGKASLTGIKGIVAKKNRHNDDISEKANEIQRVKSGS